MATDRRDLEKTSRQISGLVQAMVQKDCSFCLLMWGPVERGEQWTTWSSNAAPVGNSKAATSECRKALANQLRMFADAVEACADQPPLAVQE